jgi:hypothetical protein
MVAEIGLGELLWSLLILYIILQLLIVTVVVIIDLFHSDDLSGAKKAGWLAALLFIPLITLLVYLVARGDGIGERRLARNGTPPPPPPTAAVV